jgi:UDP:flavonoid glycosyltransferase YjiC (YdhE family)
VGRFLFSCHDAGGTVPPVLAVAEVLVERGHDVTILSQPSVARRATAIGCAFVPFSQVGDYRRDVVLEGQLDVGIPMLTGESIAVDVLESARQADVLVVDPNLAGALAAAEVVSQPSVVLLHSLFKTFVDVWFGDLWPFLADPINATRRAVGADDAVSWADMITRHDAIISPVPSAFDTHVESVAAALDHVGFLVPRSRDTADLGLPPGDDPLVAVSFSTTFHGQDKAIECVLGALADERVRIVVTTSGQYTATDVPDNAAVAEFVPHAGLFAHADAVITHGGLGTIAAALRAALPTLCIPMGRDQFLNAERVCALGAGVMHLTELDAHDLRRHVRALLDDPRYRAHAAAVADKSRSAGEAGKAAAILTRLLPSRRAV